MEGRRVPRRIRSPECLGQDLFQLDPCLLWTVSGCVHMSIIGRFPPWVSQTGAPPSERNPNLAHTYSAPAAPWSDLDLLLHHFWSSPPNPNLQPRPESFGWWPGKVAGDLRSFSQVVAGMGDGGGRIVSYPANRIIS
jgi:hypothetical protein